MVEGGPGGYEWGFVNGERRPRRSWSSSFVLRGKKFTTWSSKALEILLGCSQRSHGPVTGSTTPAGPPVAPRGATSHPLRAAACTVSGAPSKGSTDHSLSSPSRHWRAKAGRSRKWSLPPSTRFLRPHRELRAALSSTTTLRDSDDRDKARSQTSGKPISGFNFAIARDSTLPSRDSFLISTCCTETNRSLRGQPGVRLSQSFYDGGRLRFVNENGLNGWGEGLRRARAGMRNDGLWRHRGSGCGACYHGYVLRYFGRAVLNNKPARPCIEAYILMSSVRCWICASIP